MILLLRVWLQKFIKNDHFKTKNENSMTLFAGTIKPWKRLALKISYNISESQRKARYYVEQGCMFNPNTSPIIHPLRGLSLTLVNMSQNFETIFCSLVIKSCHWCLQSSHLIFIHLPIYFSVIAEEDYCAMQLGLILRWNTSLCTSYRMYRTWTSEHDTFRICPY